MKVLSSMGLCALALVGIAAAASEAQAAPTVELSGPASAEIGSDYELTITVNLPQGVYSNLQVDLQFPNRATTPEANFLADGGPADFVKSTVALYNRRYTAAAVDLSTAAAVRTFKVRASTVNYYTYTNTPHVYTASVSGLVDINDGNGPQPFGPIATSHTVVATGAAVPEFSTNYGVGNAMLFGGVPGIRASYLVRAGTTNLRPLGGARQTSYVIPAGLRYLGRSTFDNNYSVVSEPTVDDTTGGTVVLQSGYSEALWSGIDVFIPCSSLPLSGDLSRFAVDVSYSANFRTWQGDENGGLVDGAAINPSATIALPLTDVAYTCGTGGGFTKRAYYLTEYGRKPLWELRTTPPFGVPQITDAMVVDILPPDLVADGIYHSGIPVGWEAWSCNFPLTYITAEYFITNRDGDCQMQDPAHPDDPWVSAGDTHVVFYRESWEPRYFALDFGTRLTATWATDNGPTVTNRGYFNGEWFDGTSTHQIGNHQAEEPPAIDLFESVASMGSVPGQANIYAGTSNPSGYYLDANAGTGNFVLNAGYYIDRQNPHDVELTASVPPGVIVDGYDYHDNYPCVDEGITIPPPNLSASELVWTIPGESVCAPQIILFFHLDPAWPFVHREQITFGYEIYAPGALYASGQTASRTFEAIVAEGMDVKLVSSCWAAGQGLPSGNPGSALFKVTGLNRGQQDLTGVDVTFHVPSGSTFHAATLGTLVSNGGDVPDVAFLQYSNDNGGSWSNSPSGTVTDVRLTGFDLAGQETTQIRPYFYVTVDPTGVTGTITGEAVMSTFELGDTPTKETPFAVGTCPTSVVVQKFFDANNNGVRDGGEPNLAAGFGFDLVRNGRVVASATTDANGQAIFADIVPGDYQLHENAVTAIEGVWVSQGDDNITVSVTGGSAEFGNVCTCPATGDSCNVNTCDSAGECNIVSKTCNDNDPCTIDACIEPGVCSFEPDPNAGEECGLCGGNDPACAQGGWAFYVAVTGTNGQSGVIKCELSAAGVPSCDTDNILTAVCE